MGPTPAGTAGATPQLWHGDRYALKVRRERGSELITIVFAGNSAKNGKQVTQLRVPHLELRAMCVDYMTELAEGLERNQVELEGICEAREKIMKKTCYAPLAESLRQRMAAAKAVARKRRPGRKTRGAKGDDDGGEAADADSGEEEDNEPMQRILKRPAAAKAQVGGARKLRKTRGAKGDDDGGEAADADGGEEEDKEAPAAEEAPPASVSDAAADAAPLLPAFVSRSVEGGAMDGAAMQIPEFDIVFAALRMF